ncbi:MAG: hypothetical protein U1E60_08910 [Reyranellaceae bacterium]
MIGFNIGVELGQLVFVAIVMPPLGLGLATWPPAAPAADPVGSRGLDRHLMVRRAHHDMMASEAAAALLRQIEHGLHSDHAGQHTSRWTSLRKRTYGRRPSAASSAEGSPRSEAAWFTLNASTPRGNKFFYNINAKVGARAVNRGSTCSSCSSVISCDASLARANAGTLSVAERDAFSNINLGMP